MVEKETLLVVLWGLLGLVVVAVVFRASRVDWAALRSWYHTLPNPNSCALALLAAAAILLVLRGIVLLVFAREVVIISVAAGGLVVLAVLMLVYHSPRK